MKQTLKIIAVSALVTAALIKGVPALAEPTGSTSVAVVPTSDLDLASEGGQKRLEQRLTVAAHEVCDTASSVDLRAINAERDCRAAVIVAAREKAREILAANSRTSITVAVK